MSGTIRVGTAVVLAIVFGFVFLPTLLRAQESAPPASKVKVAVIDLDKLIKSSEAGTRARNKLAGMQKQEEEYIRKEEDQLKQMQRYLMENSLMLNEEAKEEKTEEMRKKKVALDRQMEDFKADYIKMESRLVRDIQKEVSPIIEDYALKNGITVILNSRVPGPTELLGGYLLYFDDTIDITQKITSLYNVQYTKQKSKPE
jgi:outer membrane protein